MTADQHNISTGLDHAGRDRTDAGLGHQLDRNIGGWIDLLQVEDQLCEILDRIDIMVRWWRDQRHARCGMPDTCDLIADLVAGQLAAFARLGALRHLDL